MLRRLVFILFILILLQGCQLTVLDNENLPVATNGRIDLSAWNFKEKGMVPLEGEWEFYWNALYEPSEFPVRQKSHSVRLPHIWNDETIDGKRLPATGYATYRLHIELGQRDDIYAIKVPYASTAYRMWINGQLVAENGIVGTDERQSQPQYINRTVFVHGDTDLIIQVSNFDHRRGGLFLPLTIGTPDQIIKQTNINIGKHLFLFGSLFIISIYYLALFLYRPTTIYHLYFSIVCLCLAIHNLLIGEVFITKIFQDFNWFFALKLEYLMIVLSIKIFFPLFINRMFPRIIHSRMLQGILCLGFIYFAIIIFTPPIFFTRYVGIGHVSVILLSVYLWLVLLQAIVRKREGAKVSFVCFTVFILTVFNDIIYSIGIIRTGYSMYWGLYFYIFGQALLLSMNFSKSFLTIERLTEKLQGLNQKLEEKVKIRTQMLEKSNKQYKEANRELKRMNEKIRDYEKSRKQLLTNISHELRTPMTLIQGYLEALIHNVIVDPVKREQHLVQIHGKAMRLNRLIEDLFELSRLEVKQASFQMKWTSAQDWLRKVSGKCANDVKQKGIAFVFTNDLAEHQKDALLYIDPVRMEQVFSNLIFNAIKYTPQDGTIGIFVDTISQKQRDIELKKTNQISDDEIAASQSESTRSEQHMMSESLLHIKITDSGTGIHEDDLPYIFHRFYKSDKNHSRQGSGLGLAISKEIVSYHGGHIWAQSTWGEGSTFHFTLPIYMKNANEA